MALAGFGRLGLWLHLRQGLAAEQDIPLPDGQGPLLLMHVSQPCQQSAQVICHMLRKSCKDLRILYLSEPEAFDADTNIAAAHRLLERSRPAAVLLIGTDLPVALITAATHRKIPVILGEANFQNRETRWTLNAGMRRELLQSLSMIFTTDSASHELARRIGIGRQRVTNSGPITESFDPLPNNEAELAAIVELLNGRHSWLAVCVPPAEEKAILNAHLAAVRQAHRTLLFVVPASPDQTGSLVALFEKNGLNVAQRALDEDPLNDVQVLIADSTEELGLWYRLAPVSFMGGTLSGDDGQTRHPFEPAALGSAVVHGPETTRFETAWRQLDRANAALLVEDRQSLATTIAELTRPEMVADLASNAWDVSTGGVGVAARIAQYVVDLTQKADQ